ncbi:MAG: phage tail protein [Pseudomonadota bacterium]
MPTRRPELDYVGAYNFRVEISGVAAGYFKSVSGLSGELEVVEFQDGDDLFLRKRPGRAKFGDVTLTKGYIVTDDLQAWWRAARDGQYDRRDISIILNDNAGNEIRRWNLYGCWPRRWETGPLVGNSGAVLEESITVVVEDMQLA